MCVEAHNYRLQKSQTSNANMSQTKRSYLLCLYVPPPLPKSSALDTTRESMQHSCAHVRHTRARSLACSCIIYS